MFTGLIEEIGTLSAIETTAEGSRITVSAALVLEDLKLGDSVAIDGACTTVVALSESTFSIEATPETLSKTTFAHYEQGGRVNLERPLLPVSRLGGHYVTGHVDGLAEIVQILPQGNSQLYRFKVQNPELLPLLVEKGSVAVNGISLTVNAVIHEAFAVAIIPHTLTHTTLGDKQVGDLVNIEMDLLGKYVQRLMQFGRVDLEQLATEPPAKTRIYSGTWFCHDRS
jgi:riboflavin synthase